MVLFVLVISHFCNGWALVGSPPRAQVTGVFHRSMNQSSSFITSITTKKKRKTIHLFLKGTGFPLFFLAIFIHFRIEPLSSALPSGLRPKTSGSDRRAFVASEPMAGLAALDEDGGKPLSHRSGGLGFAFLVIFFISSLTFLGPLGMSFCFSR